VVHHDAAALPFALRELPVVDCLLVLFEAEEGRLVDGLHVEDGGGEILEVLLELLVGVAGVDGGADD
jgi:hypothetical protein